jgi:hypothetical protein
MTYQIRQERTYITWLTVEANSESEAESRYLELIANGTAYDEELKQMNVDDENYEIYPTTSA